ncbi:MAG: LDH2 family malate/lactate/ureidoglycolate dehydrogenase [Candidatus Latescibacterota bacterium]
MCRATARGILAGTVPEGERKFAGATRGFLIVALDPAQLNDAGDFKQEVSRIILEARSLKPMPGLPSTELPGSLEWQHEQEWRVEGVPISEDHKTLLESVANTLNLSVPWGYNA